MTCDFPDDLPAALRDIRVMPLFVLRLSVRPLQIVGDTPGVFRRIGVVPGGSFSGARLSGEVLEGGSDWQSVRSDGSTTLDVRLVLETHDGALIGMTYGGVRHGPADVIARLEKGEAIELKILLFSHRANVRDGITGVRLAQQYHRDRDRPPDIRRTRLQRV